MKLILVLSAAVLAGPVLSGCTAVSRGLGKMTANKYASAQSGTVWVVPPPQLDPPSLADKTIYISYRNLSDATSLDLKPVLLEAARNDGWTVVDDAQAANFRLRAQTRFFGEVAPDSGGADVASKMGWISGAAVGIGTGVLIADATDSAGWGFAGGAAVGGIAGMGVANASTPREWAMVTDFVLEERTAEPIEVEFATNDSSSGDSSSGTGNSRTAQGGSTSSSNSSGTSMTKVQNYYPHGVRLSSWANQMNMSEQEAIEPIIERTRAVVAQMLPQ